MPVVEDILALILSYLPWDDFNPACFFVSKHWLKTITNKQKQICYSLYRRTFGVEMPENRLNYRSFLVAIYLYENRHVNVHVFDCPYNDAYCLCFASSLSMGLQCGSIRREDGFLLTTPGNICVIVTYAIIISMQTPNQHVFVVTEDSEEVDILLSRCQKVFKEYSVASTITNLRDGYMIEIGNASCISIEKVRDEMTLEPKYKGCHVWCAMIPSFIDPQDILTTDEETTKFGFTGRMMILNGQFYGDMKYNEIITIVKMNGDIHRLAGLSTPKRGRHYRPSVSEQNKSFE